MSERWKEETIEQRNKRLTKELNNETTERQKDGMKERWKNGRMELWNDRKTERCHEDLFNFFKYIDCNPEF